MVERQEANRDDSPLKALRKIRQDKNLYPVRFGKNEEQVTKQEMYERLFGHKARHGETNIVNDEKAHTPGHYDRYPMLPADQINRILAKHIAILADSRVLMYLEGFLQKDLDQVSMPVQPKTASAA